MLFWPSNLAALPQASTVPKGCLRATKSALEQGNATEHSHRPALDTPSTTPAAGRCVGEPSDVNPTGRSRLWQGQCSTIKLS